MALAWITSTPGSVRDGADSLPAIAKPATAVRTT
jgi:hypothetical protein